VTTYDLLSKFLLIMELRFDAILYSNLSNGILMRTISNVHAGRRFPPPLDEFAKTRRKVRQVY